MKRSMAFIGINSSRFLKKRQDLFVIVKKGEIKMITHVNFDENETLPKKSYELPDKIESIEFQHDGGRITILINDKEVYYDALHTRDCCITLDRS